MAITESKESREINETSFGSTMRRVFNALWTDWDNRMDIFVGTLLGDATADNIDEDFTSDVRGLRCTQIGTRYINETNCRIVAFYSTQNLKNQERIPDQIGSWKEDFDIGSVEEPQNVYYDFGGGGVDKGRYKWGEADGVYMEKKGTVLNGTDSATSDITDIPELLKHEGTMRYRVTAYASKLFLNRILTHLNYVNGHKFIGYYMTALQGTEIEHDLSSGWDDIGKWLFLGCPVRRIRHDCWEYNFEFLYSTVKWNIQQDIQVNLYQGEEGSEAGAYNFADLFENMQGISIQSGIRTRR